MKKILILGSLGFIGSNFIRYLLYRTKDYKIFSIDNCSGGMFKNLYINKHHEFTLGDIGSSNFLKDFIKLYKPDYIINLTRGYNRKEIINIISGISDIENIPIIQISSWKKQNIKGILNNSLNDIVKFKNGIVLKLPNCFGARQIPDQGNFSTLIQDIINYKTCEAYNFNKTFPWVYVEDVCSLLYYLLENYHHYVGSEINFPKVYNIKYKDMVENILELYNCEIDNMIENKNLDTCRYFQPNIINGWESDHGDDYKDMLEKTIRWYISNKWILG